MRRLSGSFHLEVKSYLVEPLSLNGLTSHASPRAATHTRHARTNKELVSYAKRRHKKTPATLRLPGRRLGLVDSVGDHLDQLGLVGCGSWVAFALRDLVASN